MKLVELFDFLSIGPRIITGTRVYDNNADREVLIAWQDGSHMIVVLQGLRGLYAIVISFDLPIAMVENIGLNHHIHARLIHPCTAMDVICQNEDKIVFAGRDYSHSEALQCIRERIQHYYGKHLGTIKQESKLKGNKYRHIYHLEVFEKKNGDISIFCRPPWELNLSSRNTHWLRNINLDNKKWKNEEGWRVRIVTNLSNTDLHKVIALQVMENL